MTIKELLITYKDVELTEEQEKELNNLPKHYQQADY